MKQHITDEKTGISYTLHGDYYLPDLKLPLDEDRPIGIWGQRHLRYLQKCRRMVYIMLLRNGRLNPYLAELDKRAETMFSRLVWQIAEHEGITEQLKEEDQMLWVQRMNSIWAAAREIVDHDLIYN